MPIGRGEKKTPIVSRGFFLLPALFVFLVDQAAKFWAVRSLDLAESRPILGNFFHLTLVENQGIAFGLFGGMERVLFIVITLSLILLILFGLCSQTLQRHSQWGIGLILGGALGNWADRIRVGAVIDFLDFRVWPVFNFADTAITLGVGLFLLDFFAGRKHVS